MLSSAVLKKIHQNIPIHTPSTPAVETVDSVDGETDDAIPETAMHAVLECPAWTVIRAEHIGAAIGDIREHFGVLQEALGDTVLEEDVMVFRGLLGGQPGDDDMLPTADLLSRERNDELWD